MSAIPAVLELGFGQLSLALYASDTGLTKVLSAFVSLARMRRAARYRCLSALAYRYGTTNCAHELFERGWSHRSEV